MTSYTRAPFLRNRLRFSSPPADLDIIATMPSILQSSLGPDIERSFTWLLDQLVSARLSHSAGEDRAAVAEMLATATWRTLMLSVERAAMHHSGPDHRALAGDLMGAMLRRFGAGDQRWQQPWPMLQQ